MAVAAALDSAEPGRQNPSVSGAQTIGVDLAAQAARTSVCVIDWSTPRPVVQFRDDAREDVALVELIGAGGRKVGLDCPLGWPDSFVATISAHHRRDELPPRERRAGFLDPLIYRLTDDLTWKAAGTRPPLSVSTNLLGVVALRAAWLLDALQRSGVDVHRSGSGVVAEVYPAAALRMWGIASEASYKLPPATGSRAGILERLETGLATRFPDDVRARCIARHDDLDALVCAVLARAVDTGRTTAPATADERACAATEGWIHLPAGTLADLRSG